MTEEATAGPIHTTIERWHSALRGDLAAGLDELLHPEVVFSSPVVFTPQEGRELTKMYLLAAYSTFGGAPGTAPDTGKGDTEGDEGSTAAAQGKQFRYVRQVLQGRHAVLEFESELDGTYINGADFITCDDDGRITDFKVMLRPLRAVNTMHELMRAMLASMG